MHTVLVCSNKCFVEHSRMAQQEMIVTHLRGSPAGQFAEQKPCVTNAGTKCITG